MPPTVVARPPRSARRDLGRPGHQLRRVLLARHARRAVPVRRRHWQRTARIALPEQTRNVWHGYLNGVGPGQLYGFRVQGRYAPREGIRFNPNKLLIDAYARAMSGDNRLERADLRLPPRRRTEDLTRDVHNSARGMPKSVVVDDHFDWGNDRPPRCPGAKPWCTRPTSRASACATGRARGPARDLSRSGQ